MADSMSVVLLVNLLQRLSEHGRCCSTPRALNDDQLMKTLTTTKMVVVVETPCAQHVVITACGHLSQHAVINHHHVGGAWYR